MSAFFVTLGQTFKHATENSYLWSPKTKSNGATNTFYENMQLIHPGDLVFAYSDAKIKAIGIASSFAEESEKPKSYEKKWSSLGWKVYVDFIEIKEPFRLIESVEEFKHLLPTSSESPINPNTGRGYEGRYLAQIDESFSNYLLERSGLSEITSKRRDSSETSSKKYKITQKEATVLQRIGQQIFRRELMNRHGGRCQLTGVNIPELLIASHIKPWASSNNEERLDVNNGLLLVRDVDALFDKGLLSFSDSGDVIFIKEGVEDYFNTKNLPKTIIDIPEESKKYLDFHREKFRKPKSNSGKNR